MMRILDFSTEDHPPTEVASGCGPLRCLIVVGSLGCGGAERQAVLTAAALRHLGHEATLHVLEPLLAQPEEARRLGIPIDLPERRAPLPLQILRLRQAIMDHAPDAVVSFLASASLRLLLARGLSSEARRPAWIVTERGHFRLREALERPIRSALRAWCFGSADRVVLNSSALAANAIGFVGALALKAAVVPNALVGFEVNASRAREEVRRLVGGEASPVIGAVGSFQADRNHELLAEALPPVLRAHPKAHLLAIGRTEGPGYAAHSRRFQQRVARLGLEAHVTLAGEIANARALIPGFDAFVLSSSLEGSSNALAEALVAGVAIATTPVADAKELVAGAGAVSSGWSPEALARAILEALDRGGELRELASARGRELLAERAPGQIGKVWSRLLREAMNARAEGPQRFPADARA
jgi:glycosyltransferase involved in cell wall biosynthesis